jgi:hypothetical protein
MNNNINLNSSDFFTLTVDGTCFSNSIFKFIADETNEGTLFKYVKKENGSVTIQRISPLQYQNEVDKHE